jgi:hypothetical protein
VPDPSVDEQNRREIEAIQAELQIPFNKQLPKYIEKVRKWDKDNNTIYINSWHTNPIDSDFTWKIYGKYEYGLAVVTTVQDLVRSIGEGEIDGRKVGCGFVVYPTRDELIREKFEESMGSYAGFMIKSPQNFPRKMNFVYLSRLRSK